MSCEVTNASKQAVFSKLFYGAFVGHLLGRTVVHNPNERVGFWKEAMFLEVIPLVNEEFECQKSA